MSAQPSERLSGAVRHLDNAVRALCSPVTRYENNQLQEAPCLYTQLRDTITGLRNSGYNGSHQSQPPLWCDAADLLDEMDFDASVWHPQLAGVPTTPARLLSLAQNGTTGKGWRPEDLRAINQLTKILELWTAQITQLLNPESVKNFRNPAGDGFAPCPQCGRATTYRLDPSDGDSKRVPVLQWTAEAGTQCIVCKAHWEPKMTLFVSQLLGFNLPAGVLE